MENFIAFNPTKLHFGRDVVKVLGSSASKLGKKALLVYGGGSVLRNGSYHDTLNQLKQYGIDIIEFKGIKPNPLVDDVKRAAQTGRDNNVDMVVAVGGGSVIDSAKIIAICIADGCDAWDVMTRKHVPVSAVPLIAVLTLAATGTEMNSVAVLQNRETKQKIGMKHDLNYPAHSFLDPSFTLSVPKDYTAYGIVDLVAHCLEAWFGEGDASLSDRFVVSIIQEAIEFGPLLLNDLSNYVLRERMMWAATNALNNLTMYGRTSGDWGVHALGHELSFLYDTPHGASLSIMYPAWMRVMRDRASNRIIKLGRALFGVSTVDATIGHFEDLFSSLNSPLNCPEAGIELSNKLDVLESINNNRSQGLHHRLSNEEREEIINYIF